jgi:hypothetical protein
VVEPARLRQIFRLRQQTRQVRRHGQIRLHNFGLYVDRGLRGQTVKVLMYNEALRIEQAEHLLVSYPCLYDTTQWRITMINGAGRQQSRRGQAAQLMLWALELAYTVWCMPPDRRALGPRRVLHAPQVDLFDGFAT